MNSYNKDKVIKVGVALLKLLNYNIYNKAITTTYYNKRVILK
jgi:hypothetical protein